MSKYQNDLDIILYDNDKLLDITFNGNSMCEVCPTISAVTVGGKTYKADDDDYGSCGEILIHVVRAGQNVNIIKE